ncbi:hypothetical protein [Persicitalea jodogahamensis]|uniref:Uncharacterized protein n=1 Tax=Persicitalea jodogahamensis TaxID=402147 RepID=A0A8J3D6D3_9BACT|nr:hypothetical protein [Persicitalea jodogahamensis]GHB81142.1 hypothetical protein GCM10007390_39820 [Persicitalea jodogahamensis]
MMNTTRDQINLNGMRIPTNGTLWGVASGDKGETVGNTYLDTTWAKGNLKLYEPVLPVGGQSVDTLTGLALRYNVYFDEIEILMNTYNDVKALQGGKVRAFSLEENGIPVTFVNTKMYEAEKVPTGFYEILTSGKITLASHHKTLIKKPTYNAAFEVGSKDTEIMMQEDFYALQKGKARKIKPNKKGILDLMKDKSKQIEAFLKINDLDLKERGNLTTLFERYNSL